MTSLKFYGLVVLMLCIAAGSFGQNLSGKYIFVKDSDGQKAKKDAVISISFSPGGTFSLLAKMPGTTLTDKGTYKISGSTIAVSFKEMEQGNSSGSYSLEDGTLLLPFQMLKNKPGSSVWQKEGTSSSASNISTAPLSQIINKWVNYSQGKIKSQAFIDKAAAASMPKQKADAGTGYYVQGSMLLLRKYHMEALYAFAKAASLKPGNVLYLNNLSMLLINMDKYGDAIGILDSLIKLNPNIASAYGNLAIAQFFTNNLNAAGIAISKAIALDPLCGSYLYTAGVIEKKKGNAAEAQKNFNDAWQQGYAGKGREGSPARQQAGNQGKNMKPSAAPKKTSGKTKSEMIALWQGHYEAEVISAKSGETAAEANTQFGKDNYQTNINLVTLACVKSFSMDISKSGVINGSGEIMYVYQGGAMNPVASVAGITSTYGGGFKTNLKNGYQLRNWNFTGSIDENGNIEITGLPSEKLDLHNVNEWQKITPWSPLKPDAAGAAMKGPFHLQMTEGKDGKHFAQLDEYLSLNDKLIKKVHYRTLIIKTNEKLTPDCNAPAIAPAANDCPASEYIKTKVALTEKEHFTVEASTTYTKDANGNVQAQHDQAINTSSEFNAGMATASVEFHTDGSFECTIGIGLSTPDFENAGRMKAISPKLSEKLELVYDSKCGFGVKGSAAVKGGTAVTGEASASVEGVIFFNAGL